MRNKNLVYLGVGGLLIFGGILLYTLLGGNSSSLGDKYVNYTFNTKANFLIKESGKENGFKLNIKDASILTKDNGLKERIQIGNLDLKIIGEKDIKVNNLDIISDEEKVYIKGNIKDYLKEFPQKLREILEKGEYARIDNSDPILRNIGKLKNNELIKELVTGMVTSNPDAYFKKYHTYEKFKKYFISDRLLNFIFKDNEYDKETKKTSLVFNEKICDLSPVVNNIFMKFYGVSLLDENKDNCVKDLKEANQILKMINIYKKGDSKNGNYLFAIEQFAIEQGTVFNLNINYKEHNLTNWKISLITPKNEIKLKANGTDKKLLSSLLGLNIKESGILIKGEVKDGVGKINFDSQKDALINLKGYIDIDKYFFKKYNLNGDSKELDLKLEARGTNKEGYIKYQTNSKENLFNINYKKEIGNILISFIGKNKDKKIASFNFNLDYGLLKNLKYKLSVFLKGTLDFNLNGDFKDKKIILDYKKYFSLNNKEYLVEDIYLNSNISVKKLDFKYLGYVFQFRNGNTINEKINLSLKDDKIVGDYFYKQKKQVDINGDFYNLGKFNVKLNLYNGEGKNNGKITFVGKKEDKKYKYAINMLLNSKQYVNGNFEFEKEKNKITSKGLLESKEEKFELKYDFEHNYNYGKAKYKIPKQFKDFSIKANQIFVLPNFEKDYYKAMLITSGLGVASTLIFISLQ